MTTINDRREAATRQIGAKREFQLHLGVYLVVNTMLIIVWAATGAGYFWPIWPIAGWAIGLASHAYDVYYQSKPITEDEIQAEMRRQEPHHTQGY